MLVHDYYQILNVPPTATLPEIKLAYHTLLLKHHPDKNIHSRNHHLSSSSSDCSPRHTDIDISLLKEAYTTLSSPLSRSQYDTSLQKSLSSSSSTTNTATKLGPRPAQVVSLEDFAHVEEGQQEDIWEYPCRCGGMYQISESDMDKGQHLVGCRSCSEVIWVGYELVVDDEDEGQGS
ncbi:hypothetical protein NP233_g3649 [Leucocoprinus birnbaumii]|uniref:Diphthamide biosynthesis protein 4 n=1 Tax=Leucocoprinus birnbaumii TaxID=56174 RepID=A0AAD5YSM6_9AGAR|nr:hypothetical protein NP233_g3649 [Leucocoprinus birnbaumii]